MSNRPDLQLVNLQYGDVEEEILKLKHECDIEVINLPQINKFHDLDGLASLMAACNKVVSVNATVHLAGALVLKLMFCCPSIVIGVGA